MKKLKPYLITFAVCAAFTISLLSAYGVFEQTDKVEVIKNLSDSFIVPGIMALGLGLLFFGTNGGAFDMLAFGVIKLFDVLKKDLTKVKYHDFYEYKQSREGKKREFLYLVLVGLLFLVVGLIFTFIYDAMV